MDQLLESTSKSINKLIKWVNHSYLGWDPYDGLNSILFGKWCPDLFKIAIIQANRLSPINFRSILSIKPGIDTKGVAIFLQAYCKLSDSKIPGPLEDDGPFLYSKLMKENILCDNTISWSSHYFNHIGIDRSILTPNTADLIGTSNAIRAICQYSNHKDIQIENVIKKYHNFLLGNFDYDHGCFKYSYHIKNKYVPNCDAEVFSSLMYARKIVWNDDINKICLIALEKLLDYQNDDGSWYYAYYHDGNIYKQLDFHQGFIINGLIDIIEFYPEMKNRIEKAIKAAANSYNSLFSDDGIGFYRYPIRYPVDIHNQAQGIITYSKLYKLFNDEKFNNRSKAICKWTIENMQHPCGYFYYQKGKFMTNKIPYMRWSQAWMMLALGQILESIRTGND